MSALSDANTSTAFLQHNTQHSRDQIYCTENCVCLIYMEQWSGNVITKFIPIPPWLEGWALLCCWFFFNRRRSHCAQPIQHEQQSHCGAQKCHRELWLKLQLPTPSTFVLPAESICSKAKSETVAQTWVSKFLCCCWILWTLHWDDGGLSLNGWCFPTQLLCHQKQGSCFHQFQEMVTLFSLNFLEAYLQLYSRDRAFV